MERTQKLESLGVLADGIAHDFNNLLTVIMGQSELSLLLLPEDSKVANNISKNLKATENAAQLAKQMLAFSGKGQFVIEPIDLNHLLEEMLPVIQVSLGKQIELGLDVDPSLPCIDGDAVQLRQLVMNLIVNAREAIVEQNCSVSMATGCLELKSDDLPNAGLMPATQYS